MLAKRCYQGALLTFVASATTWEGAGPEVIMPTGDVTATTNFKYQTIETDK